MKEMIYNTIKSLVDILTPLVELIINSGVPTVVGMVMILMLTVGMITIACTAFDALKECIRRAGAYIIIKYNL